MPSMRSITRPSSKTTSEVESAEHELEGRIQQVVAGLGDEAAMKHECETQVCVQCRNELPVTHFQLYPTGTRRKRCFRCRNKSWRSAEVVIRRPEAGFSELAQRFCSMRFS